MKFKLILTSVFVLLFALSVVSAADFSVSVSNELSKSINETVVTITNNNLTDAKEIFIQNIADIDDDDSHTILIDQDTIGSVIIPASDSIEVTVSYSLSGNTDLNDLALGRFSTNLRALDINDTEVVNTPINFRSTYCDEGNIRDGSRELEIDTVRDKSSDYDWKWRPLDVVEVDVKVRFTNDDDDNDDINGIIKLAVYDTEKNEFIEIDSGNDEIERDISLDEGERVTETFFIEVPVENIKDSNSRYKLYIKAYEDGDEDMLCTDIQDNEYFQDIKIQKETYNVLIDDIEFTSPVPCDEEVLVTARVTNVGRKDEDRVIVTMHNSELDLDLESNSFSLNEGESDRISFSFKIPEEVEEKAYKITMYSSFRYSSSSKTYREQSDDSTFVINVEGNCKDETASKNAQISAQLDTSTPDAIAGKELRIRASIRNTGDSETTYILSVLGNSLWSDIVSLEPTTVTLSPGSSKDIMLVLDLDNDATGERDFTIRATYDGKITEQKVALAVSGEDTSDDSTSTSDSGQKIADHLRRNWFIYVILLINIILIIAIISVVSRMVGSGRSSEY